MKRTWTVISTGIKKGWIVGSGGAMNGNFKDEQIEQISLDIDHIENPLNHKVVGKKVEYCKEAEIFYLDIEALKKEHEEFYATYLKGLADSHGFALDSAKYSEDIERIKKSRADIKAKKDEVSK